MKKLPLIIVLMSMALIGIIAMQSYWISRAISLKTEEFEKSVNRAMVRTVLRLERDEALQYLGQNMESVISRFGQLVQQNTNSVDITMSIDSVKHSSEAPKLSTEREYVFKGKTEGDSWQDQGVDKMYQYQKGDTAMVIIEASGDYEKVKERIRSKSGHFYTMVDEFLSEMSKKNMSLESRIDSANLSKIIQQELERYEVNIPYHYGVFLPDSQLSSLHSVNFHERCLEDAYQMALFPNGVVQSPGSLHLCFPEKSKYLFSKLSLLIILSLVFTGIILYIFTSTIRIILRQKKLSEIKTDFINNMTHEFKTPIATVSLATDALRNKNVYSNPEKLEHYTSIIKQENARMHSHVERVLQISLLDRQEVTMHKDPVDMRELIVDVLEKMELQVKDKSGDLTADIKIDYLEMEVDVMHISNVISNLIDNAIKYSDEAPIIHVSVEIKGRDLWVTVSDKGIGMDAETQKHVFEKFYRKPTGNVHNVKGFGLGLSYVKAVVDAHGGQISLESELKKGSTFIIRLPIQK